MKYLDCVEVIVEKEEYAKHGVHKGMQGVIWLEECTNGEWDGFGRGRYEYRWRHSPCSAPRRF